MVAHEWVEGWCKHCGASESGAQEATSLGYASTCLERDAPSDAARPEPARRIFAADDFDTIGKRLGELRGEQDAARGWQGDHEHV